MERNKIDHSSKKRSRSRSPLPWHRQTKSPRRDLRQSGSYENGGHQQKRDQESFAREQTRRNQAEEDAQMREWVSKEDEFVLKQSKKKAQIRVREGRAKPIDWLAVILSVIDPTKDLLDDESSESELEVMDPEGFIEELDQKELQVMEKEIDHYLVLEKHKANRAYWNVSKSQDSHNVIH